MSFGASRNEMPLREAPKQPAKLASSQRVGSVSGCILSMSQQLPEFEIRPLTADELPSLIDELIALQRRAYSREAEILGRDDLPILRETPEQALTKNLSWHAAMTPEGRPVAATAFEKRGDANFITRVIVDPDWHRRGLGGKLVESIPDGPLEVITARDNPPGVGMYERLGFSRMEEEEPRPGFFTVRYRRERRPR